MAMFKNVKVKYPKKKTKVQAPVHIKEPERKTMYDVLLENLKLANRKTFIHRLVYIGKHFFNYGEEIVDFFSGTVMDANASSFHSEDLSGFLLFYEKHYIHMVEGDEDVINTHLEYVINHEDYSAKIGPSKVLIQLHHINNRLTQDWKAHFGIPAKLHKGLNKNLPIDEIVRLICYTKKHFIHFVTKFYAESDNPDSHTLLALSSSSTRLGQSIGHSTGSTRTINELATVDKSNAHNLRTAYLYRKYLPETDILNMIISLDETIPIKDYYKLYGQVPQRDVYKDKVWPIPSDFVPYDIFNSDYDPTCQLPTSPKAKESSKPPQRNKSHLFQFDGLSFSNIEDLEDDLYKMK